MTTTNQDRAGDHRAITGLLADLVEVWGRHDADAYGALFTADATYTTFVGTRYRGRREIADSHRALFEKFLHGTALADEIDDIRFVGADTAVVTSRGDTYKKTRPRTLGKVQTYTVVRDDGQWRIAAFHNTKRRPWMEAISFRLAPRTAPATGSR